MTNDCPLSIEVPEGIAAAYIRGKAQATAINRHLLCLECFDFVNRQPYHIFKLSFDCLLKSENVPSGAECAGCGEIVKVALKEYSVLVLAKDIIVPVETYRKRFFSTDIKSALDEAEKFYETQYSSFEIKSIKEL